MTAEDASAAVHHGPLRAVRLTGGSEQPSSVPGCRSGLAERMVAARPVTWRGKGDLPQVTWSSPCRGTWLVLDCWAGVSGLCMALLQLGWNFYAVAAEIDQQAAAVASANMPNVVHVQRVEDLHAADFAPFLKRRTVRGILLGGGSPCQGNSSLNLQRRGLADPRSCQPQELQRLKAEFEEVPECARLEIILFLENVGSMPRSVRDQYSAWLGGHPVGVNAASCGWVQRRRLYWIVGQGAAVHAGLQPPDSWHWAPADDGPPFLHFQGSKPCPARVFFHQGFQPLFDPVQVVAEGGQGAFHTFTREFRHPTDRVSSASAAAAARFEADDRRFPPASYEERSLLWCGSKWRQPLPAERAQMHGIPPECLGVVSGDPDVRRQRQNSLLGNGFHVFSLLALFSMLPQVLSSKLYVAPALHEECALKERLLHTVWVAGRLDAFPGLMTAADVVDQLPILFPGCPIGPDVWHETGRRLQACSLARLQVFTAWCRLRGIDTAVLGPQALTRKDRTQASAGLVSPFTPQPWPELDVAFVVDTVALWRQFLPALAGQLRHVLKTVASALQPLERALAVFRSPSAQKVAAAKKPGFVAVMTVLLRWPDQQQAIHLLQGYPIVGDIAPTGVFRAVAPQPADTFDEWVDGASAAIDAILRSRPPRFHEESDPGRAGQGPLERFLIQQPDGKHRVIDNCRKTAHNANTAMWETIHTVNIDFVASVSADLCRKLHVTEPALDDAQWEWLRLRIGTDDLPDAYRGLPVAAHHQRFSVVAIYVADVGWRFTILWGLAFGLESAVVAFKRFPQLGIAIARRCVVALTAAYFDHELAVEMVADADPSQVGLRQVFNLLGAPPQPSKGFLAAANRHYLGTSLHLGDFMEQGFVRVQPKFLTTMKVLTKIVADNALSRDAAGKLRGDLNWFFSMCMGHLRKLVGPVLTAHQSGTDAGLTPHDRLCLEAMRTAFRDAHPRDMFVLAKPRPVTRVYSDASFEEGVLRLGWIVFPPEGQPTGGSCCVPAEVISTWKQRSQQIFPGETVAALVPPLVHPLLFADQDLVWFIDNTGAAASLIRGASAELDVLFIVQQVHLELHRLRARPWYEWIDSESNPSDGLSRLGVADPWTAQQPWAVQEYSFPHILDPQSLLLSLLEADRSG
eukprot:s117_g37.t2